MTCQQKQDFSNRGRTLEQPRLQIDRLPLAYMLIDADNCVLDWNSAAESIFGYTKEEALGQDAISLLLPLLVNDRVREVLHRVRAGDMEAHSINENRTKDGRLITCEWFNTPLTGVDGGYAGVISLAHDITMEKQAEEKLRRSEILLAEAQQLAHLGSWELQIPSHHMVWSEELYRILGLEPNEIGATYEAFLERVHSDDRARVSAVNARTKERAPFEYVYRIARADGEIRAVRERARLEADGSGAALHRIAACHDITEQTRTTAALEASRHRFQAIFENALEAILLTDSTGHFVDGNPAACQLLDYTPDELRQLHVSDVAPVHDRERITELQRRFLADGTLKGEYTLLRNDGETREVEFRSVANILPGLHLSVHRDVTEQKRAEQELKKQNEILQTIFDHIPVMINFVDAAGRVQMINRHWERVLGWSLEEAQDRDLLPECYPDPICCACVREYVLHPLPGWTNFSMRLRDGRTIDTSWSIIVLSDGTRIGFGQDLSEPRRAEAETRTLNAALENAVEGISRLDSEGNYLSVNRAYAELLGYEPEDLIAGSWQRTVHPDDVPKVEDAYQRMLCDERVELEVRAVRKDGSVFWKHVTMVKACNQQGQWIGHYCFMKDISERKQAENALRQFAVRLKAVSRRVVEVQEQERRHLARELHDEIGQVLSTIGVNLHAIMDSCYCDARTRLEDSIKIVNGAIQQVHNLSLDLRPSMLDDLGLISTLRWCANRQAQVAGFELSFVVESSAARLPADLEITCYRVAQEALTNVVRHAQSRRVWVDFRQQEEEVQLVIRDDGIGFDLDAVRQGAARGASFGVIGMEERVELLGGQIEITSNPGQGTGIQVRFPLSSQPTPKAESQSRQ